MAVAIAADAKAVEKATDEANREDNPTKDQPDHSHDPGNHLPGNVQQDPDKYSRS